MNDNLACAPYHAARPRSPFGPVSPRRLTTGVAATRRWRAWRERIRFRWQLEQMLKDNPHLIDDIGLTRRQVEAEIAKRFWQP